MFCCFSLLFLLYACSILHAAVCVNLPNNNNRAPNSPSRGDSRQAGVTGSFPGRSLSVNDSRQVIHTHDPLSPNCIICWRLKADGAVLLVGKSGVICDYDWEISTCLRPTRK